MRAQFENWQLVVGLLVVVMLAAVVMYVGADFQTMITNLQGAGFYSYILPFVLIFAVVYAVLKSTKTVDNMTALIIALVIALFSILFLSTLPIVSFLSFFLLL